MPKGQLPKAYLRIDPNLDQTHPDTGAFVRLLCAGARQPIRGRFKSWAVLVNALGRGAAVKHRDQWKDVQAEGEAYVICGWDIWQEGDLTVGDRMRLYRERQRNGAVTVTVTEPPENRNAPSEAVGSKAVETAGSVSLSLASEQAVELRESQEAMVDFGQAVVEEFNRLRGSEFPLPSHREYAVIQGWKNAGIPLRIVLRGMADCCESMARRRDSPQGKTLAYYDSSVKAAAKMWREAVAS